MTRLGPHTLWDAAANCAQAAGRLLLCGTVAILCACAAPSAAHRREAAIPPGTRPGDILLAEPFPGAPGGASATRVLYASVGLDGKEIGVSGLIIVPNGSAPARGRNVVAWLHPTTGVAHDCAPTSGPQPFGQIQGLQTFLDAGDVVVATDYPGLAAAGTHPYLVGPSEGRAALDSVRAAIRLPAAHAAPRFAVWGHSQGGHAALFADALARAYAPELRLVGVAAAAPAVDLTALLLSPGADPLWGALLSYTVASWTRVFGAPEEGIVPASAKPAIERTSQDCLETKAELDKVVADSAPLTGTRVMPDARWRGLLIDNTPRPVAPEVPLFLAQGSVDPVIPAAVTRAFALSLCRGGAQVEYDEMPGVDHYTAAVKSAGAAAQWIADRFAGQLIRDDCGKIREDAAPDPAPDRMLQ